MTAEEMKADGAPLEGVDITPKRDEGVLKVLGGCGQQLPVPPPRPRHRLGGRWREVCRAVVGGGEGGWSLLACERALRGRPAPTGARFVP